ncbi:MAG: hypothetical protein V1832_04250 [Nitrospirota bacterium]
MERKNQGWVFPSLIFPRKPILLASLVLVLVPEPQLVSLVLVPEPQPALEPRPVAQPSYSQRQVRMIPTATAIKVLLKTSSLTVTSFHEGFS